MGTLRSWHAWLSVILALPILIVGLTAIFIAHDKALGLKDIPVSAGWLPGYATSSPSTGVEIRAVLLGPPTLVAAKQGLFLKDGTTLAPIDRFKGIDVRGLAEHNGTILVAAKTGIWRQEGSGWKRVVDGEAWSVSVLADGKAAAVLKDDAVMLSLDGRTWAPDGDLKAAVAQYAAAMPEKPLTLGNLVMDLHTGKALLPKATQWIWIDLVGAAMTFLGFTGLIMWWRTRRQKLKAAQAMSAQAHA